MSSKITVQLSDEKLAAIQALFAYNNWDWNPEREVVPVATTPVSPPNILIHPQPSSTECPDFLCQPCVLAENNRQSWWPDGPKTASRNLEQSLSENILKILDNALPSRSLDWRSLPRQKKWICDKSYSSGRHTEQNRKNAQLCHSAGQGMVAKSRGTALHGTNVAVINCSLVVKQKINGSITGRPPRG